MAEQTIGYLSPNVKVELFYENDGEPPTGNSIIKFEMSIATEGKWQVLPHNVLLDVAAALGFKDEKELRSNMQELLNEVTSKGPPW